MNFSREYKTKPMRDWHNVDFFEDGYDRGHRMGMFDAFLLIMLGGSLAAWLVLMVAA